LLKLEQHPCNAVIVLAECPLDRRTMLRLIGSIETASQEPAQHRLWMQESWVLGVALEQAKTAGAL
jgi:hypothetical protein